MDCFNRSCPFRVNQTSSMHICECVACPNRCSESFTIVSNRTLTDAELSELKKRKEGADHA